MERSGALRRGLQWPRLIQWHRRVLWWWLRWRSQQPFVLYGGLHRLLAGLASPQAVGAVNRGAGGQGRHQVLPEAGNYQQQSAQDGTVPPHCFHQPRHLWHHCRTAPQLQPQCRCWLVWCQAHHAALQSKAVSAGWSEGALQPMWHPADLLRLKP